MEEQAKNRAEGILHAKRVFVRRSGSYDLAALTARISDIIKASGLAELLTPTSRVCLKPNMLMGKPPEAAVTTNPAVVEGTINALLEYLPAGNITVADSPGGPYIEALLRGAYNTCGYAALCGRTGAKLNFDLSTRPVVYEGRRYNILTPIAEADLVINLAKLKTHTFTLLSAAVKNMFGSLPGLEKTEYHAIYPGRAEFAAMLCDLCAAAAPALSIIDAVVGMDGNGPSGGRPREIGVLIASRSPYAADLAAARIFGLGSGDVMTLKTACERGYTPESAVALEYDGEDTANFALSGVQLPDTIEKMRALVSNVGGFWSRHMTARPTVTPKCVGCGICEKSCPKKLISIKNKRAVINRSGCIKCYCCQELCPRHAIDAKKPFPAGLFAKKR